MNGQRSLTSLAAILAVLALSGASVVDAQAQNGWTANGWVTSGSIYDLTGNAGVAQNAALVAGHSYNLTLSITVPNTSTTAKNFSLSLNSAFLAPTTGQSVFWVVHTAQYPGYNRTIFSPGQKTVLFEADQGTFSVSAYFEIPLNFTIPVAKYSSPSGNGTITLHFPQTGVILASVVPAGSTSIGYFSATIDDQTIQSYQNAYAQATNLVPSDKIPSTYSSLVNGIISQAQNLNQLGLPSNGTALLNVLAPSAFPVPPSGSLQTILEVALGAALVLVVLFAVLMLRSRGRSGYSTTIVNEVQKDLAVLEVTAAKYDRAMADKLKSLREKLGESS